METKYRRMRQNKQKRKKKLTKQMFKIIFFKLKDRNEKFFECPKQMNKAWSAEKTHSFRKF